MNNTFDKDKVAVHRELMVRISNTDSVQDVRKELEALPEGVRDSMYEMLTLADSDWDSLLNTLRESDSDLAEVAQTARETLKSVIEEAKKEENSHEPFRFSSRIQDVSAAPYLGIVNGVSYVRLIFKTGSETVYSDQDLEDTLQIGTAILHMVEKTMLSMAQTLRIPPEHMILGNNFETHLASAEKCTKALRSLYDQHRRTEGQAEEPDSPPKDN